MLMEKKLALISAIVFLVLFFGCLHTNPEQEVRVISISRDLSCYERGQCMCFVCHKASEEVWTFNPLNPYQITVPSLYGGWCRFESCNITHRVQPLIEGTEIPPTGDYLKLFMYGQGPSFAAFDEANPYCNNSLSLAVRWMIGDAFDPPTIPLGSRAACYLKNNVIPAYLYYTDGTNIDAVRMGAIADALDTNVWDENKQIGPVIISPEIEFDASDPFVVDQVRAQIRAIKANCAGCLIALTPRENDWEGVNAILNDTANPLLTAEMNRDVNMIGQMALLNRQPECDYRKAIYDKMNFSRWALANFNKSTIIFYFGIANTSNDLAPPGGTPCVWTNELIAEAFDYLYIHTPDMVDSGIIGLAYYQWKDASLRPYADCVTNPDQTKCRFGLVNGSFDEKHPQFNTWFQRCQDYFTETNLSQVPLVFSEYGLYGTTCTFATLVNIYRIFRYTVEPMGFDYNVFLPEEQVFRCDACFSNDEYFGPLPAKYLGGETSPPVPLGWNDPVCLDNRYDLSEAGEQCDFDPLVMRAIAWQLGINNLDLMLPVLPQMCGIWNIIAEDTLGGSYDEITSGMTTEDRGWFTIFMTLVEYGWSGGANDAYNNWLLQKDCPAPTQVNSYCVWIVENDECTPPRDHAHWGPANDPDLHEYDNAASCGSGEKCTNIFGEEYWSTCNFECCGAAAEFIDDDVLANCCRQPCYTGPADCRDGDCNGDESDTCCGMQEPDEFPKYACTCEGAVAPGLTTPFACQTLAKYQSVLTTCPNSCSQGLGVSPPTGPAGECPFENGPIACSFTMPTTGCWTSPFCDNRITHWHGGIDIANSLGTDVRAAHAGRVTFAGPYGSAGNAVMIVGNVGACNNVKTVYYHLRDGGIIVNVGDNVASGQKIAEMGSTGQSTGPHLHFEIWADANDPNSRIDPLRVVSYSQCP